MRVALLLALLLTATAPAADDEDDFLPKDIAKAVSVGCVVTGIKDAPGYAETQVFVKYENDAPGWDFKPVMSRRDVTQGGVYKALDDCIDWLKSVKGAIQRATADGDKASKPK